MLTILSRTPPWVFVLFAALLFFGALQSRTRQVGLARVTVLPVALIVLALTSIWSTFGGNFLAIVSWIAAVGLAVLLNGLAKWPRKVAYTATTRSFLVEGSWTPLAAMMIMFFMRYAVAVSLAIHPELRAAPWLAPGVGFAYGLTSGAFLARALRILGSAKFAGTRA
jgi:hypothetical protein